MVVAYTLAPEGVVSEEELQKGHKVEFISGATPSNTCWDPSYMTIQKVCGNFSLTGVWALGLKE
jgi:hypothetical protein